MLKIRKGNTGHPTTNFWLPGITLKTVSDQAINALAVGRIRRVAITTSILMLLSDSLVDLFTVYRYIRWRLNTQAYLIAPDTEHGDMYIVANDNFLTHSSR